MRTTEASDTFDDSGMVLVVSERGAALKGILRLMCGRNCGEPTRSGDYCRVARVEEMERRVQVWLTHS